MGRQAIHMRADFDINGKPIPLKFKYVNEEQELSVVKVDRITKKDINNFAGNRMYVYYCESFENNITKTYELRYELDTCRWYVYIN